MKRILSGAALSLCALMAGAQTPVAPVHIHNGFLSGNTYRDEPGLMQEGYVIGVIDGLLTSPFMAKRDLRVTERLGNCVDSMHLRSDQATAIVNRYLDARPTMWGEQMNIIVSGAMADACKSIGVPLL